MTCTEYIEGHIRLASEAEIFSETTYLLPGGEWHMHMWGELPKCCHHKGKNGPASRWSDQVIQSSSAILCRLAWVLYFFTVHHYNRSTSKLIGF